MLYTYMVNVVCRANQFILGQNEQNLYLYGECCEESNDQNVFTYMVNVVSRAIIKMFILIW